MTDSVDRKKKMADLNMRFRELTSYYFLIRRHHYCKALLCAATFVCLWRYPSIGVGRFRILGGGSKGGQIPSRHMTS